MQQTETIELVPDAKRTIEGLRDTGYQFNTAIADIVDNSVAAKATMIDLEINALMGGEIRVSIADNGHGMDRAGIVNAMRYGASERQNKASLGKYGLGLKTASTAFARKLSVITRNDQLMPLMATWDLDHVGKVNKWEIYITEDVDHEALEQLDRIAAKHSGTVVVWDKVDRLIKNYADTTGKAAKKSLERRVESLKEHLSAVYQRYLDQSDERAENVFITVNGDKIGPWDPFLIGHSELLAEETIPAGYSEHDASEFVVKAYVLPRNEDLLTAELKNQAKLSSDRQGIYIYRENRLIHEADWLGMYQKEPHSTLLRVEFSFDYKLDEALSLDIKKSQIILDEGIWNYLREQFLPAPRREANNRYRDGERKKVSEKSVGAHDSSNNSIRDKEAAAGSGAQVVVQDANTGEVLLQNSKGQFRLMLPVGSANKPGEVFIQPTDSIQNGLLFEPAIIEKHKAVRINTSHPYYHKVYVPNLGRDVTVQGLDSLLWALCVAELSTIDDHTVEYFRDMRFEVSRVLNRLVESMPEPELRDDAA